jgi:hypothetical protein
LHLQHIKSINHFRFFGGGGWRAHSMVELRSTKVCPNNFDGRNGDSLNRFLQWRSLVSSEFDDDELKRSKFCWRRCSSIHSWLLSWGRFYESVLALNYRQLKRGI